MEEYFTRVDQAELDKITRLENRCNNKIAYAERMLEKLYDRRKNAEQEFFCKQRILIEDNMANSYGERYELIILCGDGIKVKAYVHPNAREPKDSRTFIARLALFDYYYGKNLIYRNFKNQSKYNIKDFEDAKQIAQGFLKDFIHTV